MAGQTFLTVEHARSPVEDCSGHKKMRMDSVARLQRKTPLKQRRSYFDSADYFLEAQTLQGADSPIPAAKPSSGYATPAPGTPLQQPSIHAGPVYDRQALPLKLQHGKHTAQPSRLRVSSGKQTPMPQVPRPAGDQAHA